MSGTIWPALTAGDKAKASDVERRCDWFQGDLIPFFAGTKYDATWHLGSSTYRWDDAHFSGVIHCGAGSSGTPSVVGYNSTTGFYFPADGFIALKANLCEDGQDFKVFRLSTSTNPSIHLEHGNVLLASMTAFMGEVETDLTNHVGGGFDGATGISIVFDNEIFDRHSDYQTAPAFSNFSPPVAGVYKLGVNMRFTAMQYSITAIEMIVRTNNKEYTAIKGRAVSSTTTDGISAEWLADLEYNDEVVVYANLWGGAVGTNVSKKSSFYGHLVG